MAPDRVCGPSTRRMPRLTYDNLQRPRVPVSQGNCSHGRVIWGTPEDTMAAEQPGMAVAAVRSDDADPGSVTDHANKAVQILNAYAFTLKSGAATVCDWTAPVSPGRIVAWQVADRACRMIVEPCAMESSPDLLDSLTRRQFLRQGARAAAALAAGTALARAASAICSGGLIQRSTRIGRSSVCRRSTPSRWLQGDGAGGGESALRAGFCGFSARIAIGKAVLRRPWLPLQWGFC